MCPAFKLETTQNSSFSAFGLAVSIVLTRTSPAAPRWLY